MKRSQMLHTHTLAVLVENKAGVLARVAGLFARRGFNIESLAVAPTDDRFSRITIVVDAESAPLDQIKKQLDKLVNVVDIAELSPESAALREMLLVPGNHGPDPVSELVLTLDHALGAMKRYETEAIMRMHRCGAALFRRASVTV